MAMHGGCLVLGGNSTKFIRTKSGLYFAKWFSLCSPIIIMIVLLYVLQCMCMFEDLSVGVVK